jgi:hypothetical protein
MNFEITKGFVLFCLGIGGLIATIIYFIIAVVRLKKANDKLKKELDKLYGNKK